ncbi:small integral membrane protein 3-like [Acipenser ruthenus]|uniref:small integral membrane protein 3-like n=1 Tax=Acipenser ruthenus TaxID=7906 RepID=UPI00145A1BA5|nr:small integral membrane protein 3-like [Acipenser ruthenus]
MDDLTTAAPHLPHILEVWAIVLIILATIVIMTSLMVCPAMSVIIYRVRTGPTRNEIV